MDESPAHELRDGCLLATEGLASAITSTPEATVPAYPDWTVRDLGLHVLRIIGNARIAVREGVLERPSPELGLTREDEPATLAAAVRDRMAAAMEAIDSSPYDVVWSPVGAAPPSFWRRRLLREAVLHRWDAEQAGGAPNPPDEMYATELIDEFLTTDVARTLASGEHGLSGRVAIRSGEHHWVVDLAGGSVATDADSGAVAGRISGSPAAVWLWLLRRDELPGEVSIADDDGSAARFTELISGLKRPQR